MSSDLNIHVDYDTSITAEDMDGNILHQLNFFNTLE